MKVFYHNDADGKCAAYWIRIFFESILKDIEYIPMTYTDPFPFYMIQAEEDVYIVDFSIEPEDMVQLLKMTHDVTWIDHHITAINKYAVYSAASKIHVNSTYGMISDTQPKEVPNSTDFSVIRGVRYNGVSGCMLTYCYLQHMTTCGVGEIKPFEPWMMQSAPLFTKLINDWDVWTMEYGDRTKAFITAFNAGDFEPKKGKDWNPYPSLPVEKMIKEGHYMMNFRDGWARDYLSLGFLTYFEGYKCFALNLGHCNSEYFKSLQLGQYDVYIAFVFDGVQYTVSLYSLTVDVSEIAVKYGGGGHKGAAGFSCINLPFSKALNEYKE